MTERKTVFLMGTPIGFTYRTKGGFYRAHSCKIGTGYGPFWFRVDAITWLRKCAESPGEASA